MNEFVNWLDSILGKPLISEIVAVNFNLYENGNNQWSMELVGTSSFDAEDSDWACDEVFAARDTPLSWTEDTTWETILAKAICEIEAYLGNGRYAEKLKSYDGVGVGFVDGDITIVYKSS